MRRFEGKTAMITGCNRGIGLAIMKEFAKEGADIIACTRKPRDDFKLVCEDLEREHRIQIDSFHFELSDETSIKSGIQAITKVHKKIDILVNNAGIAAGGLLMFQTQKKLKEIFQVNYFAQVQITQGIIKSMMKNPNGASILFMSSVLGLEKMGGGTSYGASKAAISFLTGSLAMELGKFNIRVNAIAPNLVETDMAGKIEEKSKETLIGGSALKRLGLAKEVASTALFLCSEDASYITGQTIRVDGGK